MPFVLDCSVTMAWIFPDEANSVTNSLRDSLATDSAIVPELWAVEVANVLAVATRRGRILQSDWPLLQNALGVLPINVDRETHSRALVASLPLSFEYGLSVYDAVYLELARRTRLPLATLDNKLRSVCEKLGLELAQ